MKDLLTILLVEDDPFESQNIIEYIDSIEDVRLIGHANNETRALELVTSYMPDAIILDLELHKGGGSGLSFLNSLIEMSLTTRPYVLVTTNNISYITHECVRKKGADFIMVKSQQDYNERSVINFLRLLKQTIHENNRVVKQNDNGLVASLEQKNQRIVNILNTELERIGISPKAIGRRYLIDGIILIINNQTKGISSMIAKKYSKSDASVERAMQNAINNAWRSSDIDDLQKYYTARINNTKGVPTMTEFIYYYAEKIVNKY